MADFSYKQPYIGVGALIERDGRYLLIEENHWPNQGLWNLPCGKLNFGETPEAAARREVKEETGLSFTPEGIVGVTSIHRQDMGEAYDGDVHILRIIYGGRASGEVALSGDEIDSDGNREIARFRWLTAEEITGETIKLRYHDIPGLIERYEQVGLAPLSIVTHIIQTDQNS